LLQAHPGLARVVYGSLSYLECLVRYASYHLLCGRVDMKSRKGSDVIMTANIAERSQDGECHVKNQLNKEQSEAIQFMLIATLVAMTSVAFLPEDKWWHFYSLSPTYVAIFMLISAGSFNDPAATSSLGIHRPAFHYWPLAVLLAIVPVVVVWLAANQANLNASDSGLVSLRGIFYLMPSFMFTAFGEEVGLRGYWLPRFASLGRVKTTLISTFFWSAWHWPLFFVGFESDGGDLLVKITLFTFGVAPAVFILNELRMKTGSIWPGTVFHCFLNISMVSFFGSTETASPKIEIGVNSVLVIAALVLYLTLTKERKPSACPTAD
jgi:membrane protease YdiL (CAAX protease family)